MATTTKTLTPTNQTITLPDMTERPNASVLVDGIGKEADAINALSEQIENVSDTEITLSNGSKIALAKCGRIVTASLNGGGYNQTTSVIDSGVIPSSYRPYINVRASINGANNDNNYFRILTSGNVEFIFTDAYAGATITYIA